ncbi:MAG: outer membrane beta-barrel protein [Microscillaceae bacterium]|nr:outer membrane beta-barrel protein [Microscillaceae bacterium]
MKQFLQITLFVTLFVFTNTLKAQVAEDSTKSSSFKFSGYVDAYYFMNFNQPATRSNLGNSGISRGFDRYPGQFQLGMVMTRAEYNLKKADVVAELGFGPNAEYGSYGNDFRYRWGTTLANTTYSAILIKQAFINYRPTDKLTFTLGQFGTHIGYEYIDAPLNFHYSINNTFNAGIPFYHTGLKATYAFSDKVSLMAGVVNGSDMLNDNNRNKSFIGQLFVSPAEGFNIYINTIVGNEANSRANGKDTSSLFVVYDLVATYQITEKFSIGTWLMLGTLKGEYQGGTYFAETGSWGGANLYMTYAFNDVFSLGARVEYFDNTTGVRGLLTQGRGTEAQSYTLTGNFTLADGHLLLKPEFRLDNFKKIEGTENSDAQQFQDKDGNFTKNTQSTFGMAAIFKF